MDVTEEDMAYFAREDVTPQEVQEYLSFITTDAKRQAEVRISQLSAEDRLKFQEAKDKELDQWISHAIFEVVSRAGVPISRIMPMRWVLFLEERPGRWTSNSQGQGQACRKRVYGPRPHDSSCGSSNT